MAKTLKEEDLKLNVIINGDKAKKQLGDLEQESRTLANTQKDLRTEMAKLSAANKKNTDEYKQLSAAYNTNNAAIQKNKQAQEELRKQIGLTGLTMSQLGTEAKKLRHLLANATPGTEQFKILQKQYTDVSNRINEVSGRSRQSAMSFDKWKNSMLAAGAQIAVVAVSIMSLVASASKIIDVTAMFQKFRAVLTNTFGNRNEADEALRNISDFAANTPFQIEELTESFVKLANRGFKPSMDEMRKLGDLASSTGKSFGQLTEAVLDAETLEFERLKEFGIKAKKNGDMVAFTFKGVTTSVKATGAEIRKYILSLGDMQGVSGSMAAISKTMGGQISNLKDNFTQLLNVIGTRFNSAIGGTVAFFSKFVGLAKDFLSVPLSEELEAEQQQVNLLATSLMDANLPAEIRNKLYNELALIAPEVVAGLDKENLNYQKLAANLELYNKQMINKIVLQKKDEELTKLQEEAAKRRIDIEQKQKTLQSKLLESEKELKAKGISQSYFDNLRTATNEAGTGIIGYAKEIAKLSEKYGIEATDNSYASVYGQSERANISTEINANIRNLEKMNEKFEEATNISQQFAAERQALAAQLGMNTPASNVVTNEVVTTETTTRNTPKREEQKKIVVDEIKDAEIQIQDFMTQVGTDMQVFWDEIAAKDANIIDEKLQLNYNALQTEIEMYEQAAADKRAIDEAEIAWNQQKYQNYADTFSAIGALFATANSQQKGFVLAQIAFDTASAISSLMAVAEANPLNSLTFGGAGLVQWLAGLARITGNVAKAKQVLTQDKVQQYSEGKYNVVGATDGRTYTNVPYTGAAQTGYYTRPALVAERGTELIVSNRHLQDPIIANLSRQIVGRVNQHADGQYPTMPTTDPAMLAVLSKLSDKIDNMQVTFSLNQFEKANVRYEQNKTGAQRK